MVTDEQLDYYRMNEIRIRVIRDANVRNDVKGYVVAWNDEYVLLRKGNRRVIKVPRHYPMQPLSEERMEPEI